MPVWNVDGVSFIESNWNQKHVILPKRKNMDLLAAVNPCKAKDFKWGELQTQVDGGVDLNRQFSVDWGQIDPTVDYKAKDTYGDNDDGQKQSASYVQDPCFVDFPGNGALSEPETVAFKNFLTTHKNELDFVINAHSNGNAFIYPFNGRQTNDIEERRPGILPIFTSIAQNAPFNKDEQKGTSKETMGIAIGGDQDDWTLATLGIPSVTAEIGYVGQFQDEW
jgi:hypothetical protein